MIQTPMVSRAWVEPRSIEPCCDEAFSVLLPGPGRGVKRPGPQIEIAISVNPFNPVLQSFSLLDQTMPRPLRLRLTLTHGARWPQRFGTQSGDRPPNPRTWVRHLSQLRSD